jgi:hypothetical protein
MSWSDFPRATDARVKYSDLVDLRAALKERCAVAGVGNPASAPTRHGVGHKEITAAWLGNYQGLADLLTPYFVDPNGNAWSKASIRAAAGLPGVDWLRLPAAHGGPTYGGVVAGVDSRWAEHVNELQAVLTLLKWRKIVMSSYVEMACFGEYAEYGSGMTWQQICDYFFNSVYPDGGFSLESGFEGTAFYDRGRWGFGHRKIQNINVRQDNCQYVIPISPPDSGLAIVGTKIQIQKILHEEGGSGAGAIDIFPAANFGGTPVNLPVTDSLAVLVAVPPVVAGTTAHISARNSPYDAVFANKLPDPAAYQPTEPPGGQETRRGWEAVLGFILVEWGFAQG